MGKDSEIPLQLSYMYPPDSWIPGATVSWWDAWMALPICWLSLHIGNGLYCTCGPSERWKSYDDIDQRCSPPIASCLLDVIGGGSCDLFCCMDRLPFWSFSNCLNRSPVLLPECMNLLSPNRLRLTELAHDKTYVTHWEDGSFSVAFNPYNSGVHFNAFISHCVITVPVIDDEEVGEDPADNPNESIAVLPSPAVVAVCAGGALGLGYSVSKLVK
jgi:hypothetical protein